MATDMCRAHDKPPNYYGTVAPDSDGHCLSCHCACDPDGPRCGHWVGCPGC